MGRLKAFISISLAGVIALVASLLLYGWMERQSVAKETVQVTKTEAVPVAVAAVDLKWGTRLEPEMVKTVSFLKESLPPGHVSDPKNIKDRVLIQPLKKNEPVTEGKLAPDSVKSGGASAVVTPGKRAIAVKGDKVIGLSGLVNPGNRVDVLVTLRDPGSDREVTKVVLQNVLVLATGTEFQENGKGDPAPVDVYTLEVSPDEGEKLALAAAEGKLQFALRNVTDADTVLTKGADITDTLASFRGVEPKPKKTAQRPKVRRPSTTTVEIIKGGEVSRKQFKF